MKLEITVTKEHWENGVCNNPRKCAIAQALGDVFGHVKVNMGVWFMDMQLWVAIPREAIFLYERFDSGAPFPGETTFTMEVPQAVIDRIDISDLEKCEHLKLKVS